jgi:DNA polymerase family A
MRIAVARDGQGGGLVRRLGADAAPAGPPERVTSLAAAVAAIERAESPRWVWASAARIYPDIVNAGVRVASCHDVELVGALLLGHEGRFGEQASLEAAWARLRGVAAPARAAQPAGGAQSELFTVGGQGFRDVREELDAVVAVHADQLGRLATAQPRGLPLLAAAESVGGLAAVEMTADGLPWRRDIHDELLTELLGPRPAPGLRPRRLAELADAIRAALHGRAVNPDSPAQLVKAFAAEGISLTSTRAHVLRTVDHPAVPLLLEYKELARLYTADGWGWLDTWVSSGRFRPEYVVGGVVSGRWASRGGGALQIPKVLRRAVVADPGWVLVVADAAQLEPRVLAALAGDRAFAQAAAEGDLYAALAGALGGERDKAKVALLSAMYGGAGGEAGQLLAVLRRRFPRAARYVDDAAAAGEEGRLVRSSLGRTCPPPSARWRELTGDGDDPRAGRVLRSRGRFTRNFVVQASAADWAAVLLASLRRRLAAGETTAAAVGGTPAGGPGAARGMTSGGADGTGTGGLPRGRQVPGAGRPHLVFFQHDEVIVHCPAGAADEVVAAARAAAEEAGRLVFGEGPVRFPLTISVVTCYADAA